MIVDWLLAHRRAIVRASRWIVMLLASGLVAISGLPPGPIDRIIATVAIVLIGTAFLAWLALAAAVVLRPDLLERVARKRAARRR